MTEDELLLEYRVNNQNFRGEAQQRLARYVVEVVIPREREEAANEVEERWTEESAGMDI